MEILLETEALLEKRSSEKGQTDNVSVEKQIQTVVSLSRRMLDDVEKALERISQVNRATHILSMNARVEAARAGETGRGFAVVAEELTRLSAATASAARDVVEKSRTTGQELDRVIADLSTVVRDNRLCDLALTSVDLIDRNLYERSCDVRWWATDSAAWQCAKSPTAENRREASRRLGQILDSYTVYLDLVLADLDGRIIANGRSSKYRSVDQVVAEAPWFRAALATPDGRHFALESLHISPLVNNRRVLIYSCVVRENGNVHGKPLGVLGIIFDWDALGQTVVQRTPLSAEEWAVSRACVVDDNGLVLADTAGRALQEIIDFEGRQMLFASVRGARTTQLGAHQVRIAHAASPGFETYRTGWHGLLIRRLD